MNLTDEELITKARRDEQENMLLIRFMELIDDTEDDALFHEAMDNEHNNELDLLYDDIDKLHEENFHLKNTLKKIEDLTEKQLQEIYYAT